MLQGIRICPTSVVRKGLIFLPHLPIFTRIKEKIARIKQFSSTSNIHQWAQFNFFSLFFLGTFSVVRIKNICTMLKISLIIGMRTKNFLHQIFVGIFRSSERRINFRSDFSARLRQDASKSTDSYKKSVVVISCRIIVYSFTQATYSLSFFRPF